MDWRAAAAAAAALSQTQNVQGAGGQYPYSSSSYAAQPPSQTSSASSGYTQQYLPQAVLGQGYNTGGYGAAGGSATQLQWGQRQTSDQQAQAAYATRAPSSGNTTTNQYGQYGGVYGAVAQQQLLGVASKGVVSGGDYQASGARSYGAQDNRGVGAGGASYVAGAGVSSVSVSGVYGASESAKYGGGYATSGLTAAASTPYGGSQQQKTDQQQQYPSYQSLYSGVDQLQQLGYQQTGAYQPTPPDARGLLDSNASSLLGALSSAYGAQQQAQQQQQPQQQQPQAYGSRGQGYPPPSPVGYGGVSLPPGRDYATGRVGGSLFQREGSYGGRSERPSITTHTSRFDDRRDLRDDDRRAMREHERERELRDRDRELERERERERERREREREKERERERERREEERRMRSPPVRSRRDMSPAIRKDDRRKDSSPRRDSVNRHTSPMKDTKKREYICKIEAGSLLQAERDYSEVAKRHPKLFISPEFSKLCPLWMGREASVVIDEAVSFDHDSIDVDEEEETAPGTTVPEKPQKGSTVWNAKVMLMSGLAEDCMAEFLSDKNNDKPPNFHKMVKFIALRRDRNAIMPPGGRWDKALDGGDPATDETALIRTAIRSVKESTQIDLSECKEWLRFAEIHYDRLDEDGFPSHKETSVFYLPKLSECIPSMENWQLQWVQKKQAKLDKDSLAKAALEKTDERDGGKEGGKEDLNGGGVKLESIEEVAVKDEKKEEKKEEPKEKPMDEEPPKQPGFFIVTTRSKTTKVRSMSISLDGLLDYDENDKDESSFELSLFGEVFAEMLQFRMGGLIFQSLVNLRKHLHRKKEERKRARPAEAEKADTKRPKTEDAKPDETFKLVEQEGRSEEKSGSFAAPAVVPPSSTEGVEDAQPSQETVAPASETDVESQEPSAEVPQQEKVEAGKKEKPAKKENKKKNKVVDKEVLKAYRYFDRNRTGYLKADDLRRLFHSLGMFLSQKVVKDLASCAVSESGRSRDEKVVYRNLVEKEIIL